VAAPLIYDVAIVGAGPAGLACAIGLRLRGLTVIVYERGAGPRDKACGEGLMPRGLAQLAALGVQIRRSHPIVGIRYINEDGASLAARLATPGLGVRRLVLSEALLARANEVGVHLEQGRPIASKEALPARFVIAADGLHSRLRTEAGLDLAARGHPRRYGLRAHFAMAPWTDHVEVFFSNAVEAYVTPVGDNEVGVAFLWNEEAVDARGGFAALLAHFPALQARLTTQSSRVIGQGPLEQRASKVVAANFALVGDAAGYVDAITGEGLSLALQTAAVLVEEVATKRTGLMRHYARTHARMFATYALVARALLFLAARPALRRFMVSSLPPSLFARLLNLAMSS
jgi:menaquinone-9 beta-reductase